MAPCPNWSNRQTERTVGFVAELVSSLPDVRFPVGVAVRDYE